MADSPDSWVGETGASTLLAALFPPGSRGFIETRCLGHGWARQAFTPIGDGTLADLPAPPADCDVLVGVAPRSREQGTRDAVEEVWTAWVDLDSPEAAASLEGFDPAPSIVVSSGRPGHLHAYWPLAEPAEPAVVELLNRALAEQLGGDVACADAARTMRLPGTFNRKLDRPVRAEVVHASEVRCSLDLLCAALGSPPEAVGTDVGRAKPSESVQKVLGRLAEVRETSNGWLALCPAHDDHNPSLSVTEVEHGRCLLYCFAGCTTEDVVAALGPEIIDLFADAGRGAARPNVAARLVALAEEHGAELFHDPTQRAFASIPVDTHREIVTVTSTAFRRWLRRHFHDTGGGVANAQAVADAVDLLCARAEFDGPEREVFVRIAPYGDGVVVDLADDEWRVVHVGPGKVETLTDSPVPFIRGSAAKPLPLPVAKGSLDELRDFLNLLDDGHWRLLVSFLVAAVIGRGPFAILILQGEKGSSKSTTVRVIRRVVDPARPEHRGGTPDERELMIAARTSWVVAFDNLSGLSPRLSDSLCRLSTGAGFGTRRLYTDDEEVVFDAMRPIVLNGIADIATRPDLVSRSIVLELPVLAEEETRPESEFYADLDGALPRIFGGLLDLAARVLELLPEVELERTPRMADFARIGVAVEQALGWPEGSFLGTYRDQQGQAYGAALDADPVAAELSKFMRLAAQLEGWNGTATELLGKLTDLADDDVTRRRNWPASASVLGRRLKELAPALRREGLEIERARSGRGNDKQRGLWIYWATRDEDGEECGRG